MKNLFPSPSTASSREFQNISILVVLMFGWQINANFKRYQDLGDVYYGEDEMNNKNFFFLPSHRS